MIHATFSTLLLHGNYPIAAVFLYRPAINYPAPPLNLLFAFCLINCYCESASRFVRPETCIGFMYQTFPRSISCKYWKCVLGELRCSVCFLGRDVEGIYECIN